MGRRRRAAPSAIIACSGAARLTWMFDSSSAVNGHGVRPIMFRCDAEAWLSPARAAGMGTLHELYNAEYL